MKMNLNLKSTRRAFQSLGDFLYEIQFGQRVNKTNKQARVVHCASIFKQSDIIVEKSLLSKHVTI